MAIFFITVNLHIICLKQPDIILIKRMLLETQKENISKKKVFLGHFAFEVFHFEGSIK